MTVTQNAQKPQTTQLLALITELEDYKDRAQKIIMELDIQVQDLESKVQELEEEINEQDSYIDADDCEEINTDLGRIHIHNEQGNLKLQEEIDNFIKRLKQKY